MEALKCEVDHNSSSAHKPKLGPDSEPVSRSEGEYCGKGKGRC